jgi:hypothetical protein
MAEERAERAHKDVEASFLSQKEQFTYTHYTLRAENITSAIQARVPHSTLKFTHAVSEFSRVQQFQI